jgi:hypothetical protein
MTSRRGIRRTSLAIAALALGASGIAIGRADQAGALNLAKVTLVATPPNQIEGTPLLLKATIRGVRHVPAPSGTVEFFDGTTSIGTAPVAAKVALLSYQFPIGTHVVDAVYSGDSAYAASTSNVRTIQVGEQSRVNVDLQYKAPSGGTAKTWTATTPIIFHAQIIVKAGQINYGPRTGIARISIDGATPQTVTVKSDRFAYLAAGGLGLGPHTAIATYLGDDHYLPDSSITRHFTIVNP